jgi:hypothetical protein
MIKHCYLNNYSLGRPKDKNFKTKFSSAHLLATSELPNTSSKAAQPQQRETVESKN